MLGLLLLLLMLALGTAAILWAGSAVIQGYWYSAAATGLWWRSAAAGGAVGVFLGLWCLIEGNWPGRFDTLFKFSAGEEKEFRRFWAVRKAGSGPEEETLYQLRHDERHRAHYVDRDNREWRRSDAAQAVAIVVEEDGDKKRFEAERPPDGSVRFVEAGGKRRVMTDDAVGRVTSPQTGLLLGNLLWNLLHVVVWFVCLWLLLEYHWTHALGLAVVFWLAVSLMVWPLLQRQVTATTGPKPAAVAAQTAA
jgi:hypothetical protein